MVIDLTFVTECLTEIDQARQSCCDNRSSWRDVQVVDRSGNLAVGWFAITHQNNLRDAQYLMVSRGERTLI